ncbi:hypothetical protein N7481_009980 [Penicillium waksmanii]|uniref:uncharacterized protein n=1 Tax=Penicillium waksmanii TaxID=69791 RepID=UPI002547B2EC|nr:uncharacterized protein N7481_009980 [Penicillium waksmanii]KAJ5976273.1 hypothetical protein N7481_009980 [Penicillium waksmanii]
MDTNEDIEIDDHGSTTTTLERDSPLPDGFYSLSRDAKLIRIYQLHAFQKVQCESLKIRKAHLVAPERGLRLPVQSLNSGIQHLASSIDQAGALQEYNHHSRRYKELSLVVSQLQHDSDELLASVDALRTDVLNVNELLRRLPDVENCQTFMSISVQYSRLLDDVSHQASECRDLVSQRQQFPHLMHAIPGDLRAA